MLGGPLLSRGASNVVASSSISISFVELAGELIVSGCVGLLVVAASSAVRPAVLYASSAWDAFWIGVAPMSELRGECVRETVRVVVGEEWYGDWPCL